MTSNISTYMIHFGRYGLLSVVYIYAILKVFLVIPSGIISKNPLKYVEGTVSYGLLVCVCSIMDIDISYFPQDIYRVTFRVTIIIFVLCCVVRGYIGIQEKKKSIAILRESVKIFLCTLLAQLYIFFIFKDDTLLNFCKRLADLRLNQSNNVQLTTILMLGVMSCMISKLEIFQESNEKHSLPNDCNNKDGLTDGHNPEISHKSNDMARDYIVLNGEKIKF